MKRNMYFPLLQVSSRKMLVGSKLEICIALCHVIKIKLMSACVFLQMLESQR